MARKIIRSVTLAALTYYRPDGLSELLDGIAALHVPASVDLAILIVDNSDNQSAKAQVAARSKNFPMSLRYLHCPERGLSAARNVALSTALQYEHTALGFIDDDEVPDQNWLVAHLAALADADVSVGTVKAAYKTQPPEWLRRGGFHDITGPGQHAQIQDGNTSNVLMRLEIVRQQKLQFHPAFALTGGEDTHFFHQFQKSGGKIVFAPSAIVAETIVKERASLRWLWRRWRRTGQTNAIIRLMDNDSMTTRGACIAAGLLRLGVGAVLSLLALPMTIFGRFDLTARGLRITARGIGFIDSALGHKTEEYKVMTR